MTKNAVPEFVDASLFLGMHSIDDAIRIACKNFFVSRFDSKIAMSLEQVGLCDAIVWRHTRKMQDAYYPFMDYLHSVVQIDRQACDEKDVELALSEKPLAVLPMPDRLLLGKVMNVHGLLYTMRSSLLDRTGLPVRKPEGGAEKNFPDALEELYRVSLQLRFPSGE